MSSNTESLFPRSDETTSMQAKNVDAGMPQPVGSGEASAGEGDLLGRVVQGAHGTIDRLADSASPQLQRLQEGMSATSDAVRMRAGALRATGDAWTESLRSTVRENPLAALAAAWAMGMLTARLTRR